MATADMMRGVATVMSDLAIMDGANYHKDSKNAIHDTDGGNHTTRTDDGRSSKDRSGQDFCIMLHILSARMAWSIARIWTCTTAWGPRVVSIYLVTILVNQI